MSHGAWLDLLPQSCSSVAEPDLDPGLAHPGLLSQVLPGVHIRILSSLESLLQHLQLVIAEGCPRSPGLPLDHQPRLCLYVTLVSTSQDAINGMSWLYISLCLYQSLTFQQS